MSQEVMTFLTLGVVGAGAWFALRYLTNMTGDAPDDNGPTSDDEATTVDASVDTNDDATETTDDTESNTDNQAGSQGDGTGGANTQGQGGHHGMGGQPQQQQAESAPDLGVQYLDSRTRAERYF